MIKLTEQQIKLAGQLLISILKKEPTVEYKELGLRVNPVVGARQVPNEIGDITKLCYQLGLPDISTKVVSKTTQVPGLSFAPYWRKFHKGSENLTDAEIFKLERKNIRECTEWQKLANYLGLNLQFPNQTLTDGASQKGITPDGKFLQIRILPMSKELEFGNKTYEQVQKEYFLKTLIDEQKGFYYYRKSGIDCPKGSVVLFQFDNQIIASATLDEIIKYEQPVDGVYKGAYKFNIHSIEIFEPIELSEITKIDPAIESFTQVKRVINFNKLPQIRALIETKKAHLFPDEISSDTLSDYEEGAKRKITVNYYERDPRLRKKCIELQGSTCKICGFNFAEFYGEDFVGKIHIHHIKPLSEVNKEQKTNPATDLIPVCPNCHMALHAKPGGGTYSIDELKSLIKRQE